MLELIISGGQTGADMGGLKAAQAIGLKTGGNAAKSYKTEDGQNKELESLYNLTDHKKLDYKQRNIENVKEADATILFGHLSSRGAIVTKNACKSYTKPLLEISDDVIDEIGTTAKIERFLVEQFPFLYSKRGILNIAGNRESKNLGIESRVETVLLKSFKQYFKAKIDTLL